MAEYSQSLGNTVRKYTIVEKTHSALHIDSIRVFVKMKSSRKAAFLFA